MELLDANNKSRLKSLELDDKELKDLDKPATAKIAFDIPDHLTGKGDLEGSVSDSPVWGKLVGINIDPDRKVPVELAAPFVSDHTYTVTAPLGYRLADAPADRVHKTAWGEFRRTVEVKPGGRSWVVSFATRIADRASSRRTSRRSPTSRSRRRAATGPTW